MVKGLADYIKKNKDKDLNKEKSRIKEIALRRLDVALNKYEQALSPKMLGQFIEGKNEVNISNGQ